MGRDFWFWMFWIVFFRFVIWEGAKAEFLVLWHRREVRRNIREFEESSKHVE